MWLSGAEGEELSAALSLCRDVFGLSSHLPQSEVFTLRSLRKKRKKRRKRIRAAASARAAQARVLLALLLFAWSVPSILEAFDDD